MNTVHTLREYVDALRAAGILTGCTASDTTNYRHYLASLRMLYETLFPCLALSSHILAPHLGGYLFHKCSKCISHSFFLLRPP